MFLVGLYLSLLIFHFIEKAEGYQLLIGQIPKGKLIVVAEKVEAITSNYGAVYENFEGFIFNVPVKHYNFRVNIIL